MRHLAPLVGGTSFGHYRWKMLKYYQKKFFLTNHIKESKEKVASWDTTSSDQTALLQALSVMLTLKLVKHDQLNMFTY